MPYLKIKTSNEPGKEWTAINNLNLDTITLPNADGLVLGDKTLSGELNSMKSDVATAVSNAQTSINTAISQAEQKINNAIAGIPDTPSFEIYTGTTEPPTTAGKKGLFVIQQKTISGTTYNLLWYWDDSSDTPSWKRIHAIWG